MRFCAYLEYKVLNAFTETKNFEEKSRQKLSTNFIEDSSPVEYDAVSIIKMCIHCTVHELHRH